MRMTHPDAGCLPACQRRRAKGVGPLYDLCVRSGGKVSTGISIRMWSTNEKRDETFLLADFASCEGLLCRGHHYTWTEFGKVFLLLPFMANVLNLNWRSSVFQPQYRQEEFFFPFSCCFLRLG
jgi:hypothetical protein